MGRREESEGLAGRFLPVIVALAALVVVSGLLSVRADRSVDGQRQAAPLVK